MLIEVAREKEIEREQTIFSRTVDIRNKIISKDELEKIMSYLSKIREDIDAKIPESITKYMESTTLKFEINYENGFKNSGQTDTVLDDYKVIESARFSIENYRFQNRIEIILKSDDSSFTVNSRDKDWFNAKSAHIEEIFAEAPKQNKILSSRFHQHNISNFFGIFVGTSIFFAVNSLPFVSISIDYLAYIGVISSMVLGMALSHTILYESLIKLYPSIEFNTAKEHLNRKSNIKKLSWKVAALVLLPLTLNFISSQLF